MYGAHTVFGWVSRTYSFIGIMACVSLRVVGSVFLEIWKASIQAYPPLSLNDTNLQPSTLKPFEKRAGVQGSMGTPCGERDTRVQGSGRIYMNMHVQVRPAAPSKSSHAPRRGNNCSKPVRVVT